MRASRRQGEENLKLNEIAQTLGLRNVTPELAAQNPDVAVGHVSDLLSDVLANAPAGGLLVTIQVHMNVIAIASHAGLAGVIFAAGRTPEESVRRKAVEEKILLFVSEDSSFEVVGRLYALGVRGTRA